MIIFKQEMNIKIGTFIHIIIMIMQFLTNKIYHFNS